MIDTKDLQQPVVRKFLDAFNARDSRAFDKTVSSDFVYSSSQDGQGGADFFLGTCSRFVVAEEADDGWTLVGVVIASGERRTAEWRLVAEEDEVRWLDAAEGAGDPEDLLDEADLPPEEGQSGTPVGTLRRMTLGSHLYVHRWGRGALGGIDWINTGEKADSEVYRTFQSPAEGFRTDEVRVSKVGSRLSIDLGWNDAGQKATARLHAELSYWDAIAWCTERIALAGSSIPKITAKLTLHGPSPRGGGTGPVISTEEITVTGKRPPYTLDFAREFSLAELPPGTYTLALTDAVKTGGSWTTKYNTTVHLKDHTVAFPVGG